MRRILALRNPKGGFCDDEEEAKVLMSKTLKDETLSTIVREFCLQCCGGSERAVIWCPNHGGCYGECLLWPFRFGVQPETLRAEYGDRLLTPGTMPHPSVDLALLPGTLAEAATGEIDIPADPVSGASAYRQAAVELRPTAGISETTNKPVPQAAEGTAENQHRPHVRG